MAKNGNAYQMTVGGSRVIFEHPNWEGYDHRRLEKLRLDLLSDLESIDLQLSSRDRMHIKEKRRLTSSEYHDWRYGAIKARQYILADLRAVKLKLAMNKQANIESLAKRLLAIAETVDVDELSADELKAIVEAKELFEGNK